MSDLAGFSRISIWSPKAEKSTDIMTTKSTFSVGFIAQKGKPKNDGTVPILARIIINGEMAHFSTKFYVLPSRWMTREGRTGGSTHDEKTRTQLIEGDTEPERQIEIQRVFLIDRLDRRAVVEVVTHARIGENTHPGRKIQLQPHRGVH